MRSTRATASSTSVSIQLPVFAAMDPFVPSSMEWRLEALRRALLVHATICAHFGLAFKGIGEAIRNLDGKVSEEDMAYCKEVAANANYARHVQMAALLSTAANGNPSGSAPILGPDPRSVDISASSYDGTSNDMDNSDQSEAKAGPGSSVQSLAPTCCDAMMEDPTGKKACPSRRRRLMRTLDPWTILKRHVKFRRRDVTSMSRGNLRLGSAFDGALAQPLQTPNSIWHGDTCWYQPVLGRIPGQVRRLRQ